MSQATRRLGCPRMRPTNPQGEGSSSTSALVHAHLTPRRSMTVIAISVSCAIGVFGLLCAIWKCRLKRGKRNYTCDFPALCASSQLCCFLGNSLRLLHSVVNGENPSYNAKNEACVAHSSLVCGAARFCTLGPLRNRGSALNSALIWFSKRRNSFRLLLEEVRRVAKGPFMMLGGRGGRSTALGARARAASVHEKKWADREGFHPF